MFMTLFIILAAWASQAMSSRVVLLHESTMINRHQQWMTQYGKVYKNQARKEQHFNILEANVEFIESSNIGNKPFPDQAIEEFKSSRNGYKKSCRRSPKGSIAFKYENVTAVPSTMDWRKKGAVTPVKDQWQCANLAASLSSQLMDPLTKSKELVLKDILV
ncbi:hypothetical protein MKX01_036593 [Papaver californicum]|nr:hypothetical protein MKX01_036593 [Papaver californicum]